jgi:transposase-like protein
MVVPRKFDEVTRARAVRLYLDEVAGGGISNAAARRKVGELLDVNPATLRGWIERDQARVAVSDSPADLLDQVDRLRRENSQLRQANAILKTAAAFFASAEVDRRLA